MTKLLKESVQAITKQHGTKGYRCVLDVSTEESGALLYICPTKGRMADKFSGANGYIWILSGVYFEPEDKQAYVYSGIGWTKDYTDRIAKSAIGLLKRNGFTNDEEDKYDEWTAYAPLKSVIGRSKDFRRQADGFSTWVLDKSNIALKSFESIRKEW